MSGPCTTGRHGGIGVYLDRDDEPLKAAGLRE
jgi:hypothetical protein